MSILTALPGAALTPAGPPGPAGDPGSDGRSAYQIAVDAGAYSGTEAEFATMLANAGSVGTTVTLIAAAPMPGGVFGAAYGTGQAVSATPATADQTTGQAIGYSDSLVQTGGTATLRKSGLVRTPGATWTAGDPIYLSDQATPTNIRRISGWVQQVGTATGPDTFDLAIGIAYVLPPATSVLVSPTPDFYATLVEQAGLNASDAAWFAGTSTVARPTVAQVMTELRSRALNVRAYGASPAASGAVNATAFAAAYADCSAGGTIIVPFGAYAGTMPTGTKTVLWQVDGATDQNGAPLNLPGQSRGVFQSRTLWAKRGTAADQQPVLDLQNRGAPGGNPNNLMTTLSVYAATDAAQTCGTWALVTSLDSYSTSQDIGNVGHEIVVHQRAQGGTPLWAGAFEVNDHAINPTTSTLTLELAVNATGADPANNRTNIFIPGNKLPNSPSGTITEVGQAVYIKANTEVIFNRLFYIPARAKEGMLFTGQIDGSAFHFAGSTGGPLIDASDEQTSQRVMRLNNGMMISFVNFAKSEIATWTIDSRGVTTTNGETFVPGSALPSSAPYAWRRVRVNGSDYMTPLYQTSQIPGA